MSIHFTNHLFCFRLLRRIYEVFIGLTCVRRGSAMVRWIGRWLKAVNGNHVAAITRPVERVG